ncbi:AraC family transcriptional regulator [Skermania sp. ID1734]|uniref:AraC family transcriptional regulator n=1 Tax=Skermania sp. ID1734 TaxID=2597516 RepID=UPI00117CD0C6|nr:AraC family transcriptional regulator [Skermania sp. ID1734]TSD94086.1 AraC family transcriptional regulator [Skermania sp. ID1734]
MPHETGPRLLNVRTSDLDAAHETVSTAFARHDLTVRNAEKLDFRLDVASSPRLTAGRMSYGAEATLIGPPMRRCYHINLLAAGQSTVEQNGVRRSFEGGSAGVAFGPNAPVLVQWSADAWQYHLKLAKDQLEAHAARLVGQPVDELRFDLTFDLRNGRGQALVAMAGFLYAELTRDGGISTIPAARSELESAVMTQVLMTVPSQLTALLNRTPAHSRRSKIREIVQYIDEHADEEVTIADLVEMAGVSARALQTGFRDVVGVSPVAYLRNVRLDRVHLELSSGAASAVTDVAARWNFFHPSRFAHQYRERFGILPSETLHQARP